VARPVGGVAARGDRGGPELAAGPRRALEGGRRLSAGPADGARGGARAGGAAVGPPQRGRAAAGGAPLPRRPLGLVLAGAGRWLLRRQPLADRQGRSPTAQALGGPAVKRWSVAWFRQIHVQLALLGLVFAGALVLAVAAMLLRGILFERFVRETFPE